MYLHVFLYYTLFFTLAQSNNSTSPERDHSVNAAMSSGSKTAVLDLHNKTKLSLVSEGGTLLPNEPDMALPKQKFVSLMSLDEELSKTKEKAVVPRKGVDNFLPDTPDTTTDEKHSTSTKNQTILLSSERLNTTMKSSYTISSDSKDIHKSLVNKTSMEPKELNSTKVHKKPMILSYEALANMEKKMQSNQPKIPVVPSSKTTDSNQIPSPNEDAIVKVYPSKANSHPGMIMPIVITILVVPMFAIVGYMALRRGQEAWKNRHYKRMDFLLDGMYND